MASTLSSLGIGSSVLTYDVIDKLRAADEDGIITPIDKKIKKNTEKQTSLADLQTSLGSLKSLSYGISDTSSYLERSTSISGEGVSASAGAGLVPQDIEIHVNKLAKSDIYEVGSKFESRSATFSNYSSRLFFQQGANEYYIDIDAGDTLEDVAQKITDETGGEIVGTILKTGGDKPYQLMINSKDTGAENKIYFGTSVISDTIIGGALEADAVGDLTVTLKDKNGNDVTLDITIPTTDSDSSASDNAKALKQAIIDAIDDYGADLSDVMFDEDNVDSEEARNKPIHINVTGESKRIIINDSRGYDITIGGTYAAALGFDTDTKSIDYSAASQTVQSASLDGSFKINGTEVSISTPASNSASANAQAIVDAINAAGIADVSASLNEDGTGFYISEASGGAIEISAAGSNDDELSESEEFINNIGLNAVTYKSGAFLLENKMNLDNMQVGRDAEFTYNDILITRSGNYIDDIVSGLSITLESEHDVGEKSVISVKQDIESVIEDVKSFVETYNELVSKLTEATKYDSDTAVAGVFQGETNIVSIKSYLNNILLTTDANNNSLVAYGIYLNEDGQLELDEEKLTSKVNGDSEGAESLFRGYTATVLGQEKEFDGVFTKFYDYLDGMLNSTSGLLTTFGNSLESEADKLTDDRTSAVKMLDTRYEIMANKFAAYDSIIASINASFQSLQMQIDALANS